jgi:hypothetical protein
MPLCHFWIDLPGWCGLAHASPGGTQHTKALAHTRRLTYAPPVTVTVTVTVTVADHRSRADRRGGPGVGASAAADSAVERTR